ncbi:4Fe-4S dicluster domain-containing protein [Sodalis sp. dw_96]|uniref:ferredoxin family protein n=1 Tax=Sodalis sp. dw_96 TaxID=2719794 RepID=UPI001BD5996C|nr:4Fe-4S dicluster domain-containing protein [Sodalis sp. dw_96]
MSKTQFGSVSERLDKNRYETDAEQSHIQIDQAMAKSTGAGPLLVRICPAHVYSMQADNTVGIMYAACLECGTCRAMAPAGVLTWHYPRSGMGVTYREG